MQRYLLAAALGAACAGCVELDKTLTGAERAIAVTKSPSGQSIGKVARAELRKQSAGPDRRHPPGPARLPAAGGPPHRERQSHLGQEGDQAPEPHHLREIHAELHEPRGGGLRRRPDHGRDAGRERPEGEPPERDRHHAAHAQRPALGRPVLGRRGEALERPTALPQGPGAGPARPRDRLAGRGRGLRRQHPRQGGKPQRRHRRRCEEGALRRDRHGVQLRQQAGGEIPACRRQGRLAVQGEPEPGVRDHPHREQLQSVRRELGPRLRPDAARAHERGREAHRRARGADGIPTKEELFDANNNIEFGTAYLNVLRTFSPNQKDAVNAINRLEPSAVYDKLRTGLPYAETRDYLQKVVGFRRQFVTAGQ